MNSRQQRLLDLSILAILAVPVLFIVGIAATSIWLINGYSPLFCQKRVGYRGAEFCCYKLQTMRPVQSGERYFSTRDDRIRMTKLGQFLRDRALDELPQLYNILKGEMSFVGPRPLAADVYPCVSKDHGDLYDFLYWRQRRGDLRPGLTGSYQINTERRTIVECEKDFLLGYSLREYCAFMARTVLVIPCGKIKLRVQTFLPNP